MPVEHGQDTALPRAVFVTSSSGAAGAFDARTGETHMNEIFQCGDSGALVAYLYDECSPGEHAVIAAHIKGCVACAGEIDALSATRRTLASWTPPDLALGFQITRSDVAPVAKEPARVLVPTIAWWRAPLPAWAQAAAAMVIFAAGLSVGVARDGSTGQSTATTRASLAVPLPTR